MKALLLVLISTLFWCQTGIGQSAQATIQIVPPTSPYLFDYASPTSQSLQFSLNMFDHPGGQADVRLIMEIDGGGINLKTNLNWMPSAITLLNGIPQNFSGFELAEYFDPYHLDFTGMSREEFIQNGQLLPDGFYDFCIKAVQFTNPDNDFSNNACATALVELYNPPTIATAIGEQPISNPQAVNFTWIPNHPTGQIITEYDVEIWEAQNGIPDPEVVNNYPMFYTSTVTNLNSYLYGFLQPDLIVGNRYITRIRARAQNGSNVFKNNGYSTIESWSFGPILCLEPENVQHFKPDSLSVHFIWESPNGMDIDEYYLEYRGVNNEPNDWVGINIPGYQTEYLLKELSPTGAYEFQLRSNCNPGHSHWVYLGVTAMYNEDIYICGLEPLDTDLSNNTPLASLNTDDEFFAGDFRIKVQQAAGANGKFWGSGYIVVPYFNKARVNAKFLGITVNDENRMIDGVINITGIGVQIISDEMANILTNIIETLGTIDDWLAAQEALLQALDQIVGTLEPYLPDDVIQQLLDARAALTAAKESGDPEAIQAAQDALNAANEAYKEALAVLIAKYNSILELTFGELENDYAGNLSGLETSYNTAVTELSNQYTDSGLDTEIDYPNNAVELELLDYDSTEMQQFLDSDPDMAAFDAAANAFWSSAKDFRIAETLHDLKTDMVSSEDIQIFTDLAKKLNLDLIRILGLKIKAEVPDAEIVSFIKPLIIEAITKSIIAVANIEE